MTMHGIYPHADDSASNIGADLGSASARVHFDDEGEILPNGARHVNGSTLRVSHGRIAATFPVIARN
jgi:hypothetical protein